MYIDNNNCGPMYLVNYFAKVTHNCGFDAKIISLCRNSTEEIFIYDSLEILKHPLQNF